jgi:hypothetical protein
LFSFAGHKTEPYRKFADGNEFKSKNAHQEEQSRHGRKIKVNKRIGDYPVGYSDGLDKIPADSCLEDRTCRSAMYCD